MGVMVAGRYRHVGTDATSTEGLHQVHVRLEGEVLVTHGDVPLHLTPSLHVGIRAVEDARDGVVVLDGRLTPFGRGVVAEELQGLTALVAADGIDEGKLARMMDAIDRSAASAHREARYGAPRLVGTDAVGPLHVGNQLVKEIGLVRPPGNVEVHHVVLVALGTDDHHAVAERSGTGEAVHSLAQTALYLPLVARASSAMQQVEHRIGPLGLGIVAIRQADDVFALGDTLEQRAGHGEMLHGGSTQRHEQRQQQQQSGNTPLRKGTK